MYRKRHQPEPQIPLDEFYMAFGGRLLKSNRWVKLAEMIPWDEVEKRYAEQFKSAVGNPAYSVRVAFGALVIKEKLSLFRSPYSRSRPWNTWIESRNSPR